MKFYESLLYKKYNSTISYSLVNTILILLIIPFNLYLYENGIFGDVSFSFIKYRNMVFKSFSMDLLILLIFASFIAFKFLKKNYTYRTITKLDFKIAVLFIIACLIIPVILFISNSFWTSIVLFASNIGITLVITHFLVLYLAPDLNKS